MVDPLEWAFSRIHAIAAAASGGLVALVWRWLIRLFVPYAFFRSVLVAQIKEATKLAEDTAAYAVDQFVADELGLDVEDLPDLDEDDEDEEEELLLLDWDDEEDFEDLEEWLEEPLPAEVSESHFAEWEKEFQQTEKEEKVSLGKAIDTIFAESKDAEELLSRIERLAENEPTQRAKEKMRKRLKARGVTKYVWVVSPKSCDTCAGRAGQEFDISTAWAGHPRCKCTLRPVIDDTFKATWADELKERTFQLRKVMQNGARFSSGIEFLPMEGEKS